jgi:hypothetical protein
MNAPELIRHAILGLWVAVLVGLFILRFNTKKLSPTVLRYMAYLGHTDPENPLNPSASVASSASIATAHRNTAAKSTTAR